MNPARFHGWCRRVRRIRRRSSGPSSRRTPRAKASGHAATAPSYCVGGAAEFAAGADHAVGIGQALTFFRRIGFQHLGDAVGGAIAAESDGERGLHPNFVFVEQPPQHPLRRECGVEQFNILHRFQDQRQTLPVVAGLNLFRGGAWFGGVRRHLKHQAGGLPMRLLFARDKQRRCGQAQHGGQLLGLHEIGFGGSRDAAGRERDNALIGVAAAPGLDGDGERAVTHQLGEGGMGRARRNAVSSIRAKPRTPRSLSSASP